MFFGRNSKADELAQETSKKLTPRKNGPFKMTSGQYIIITLDEDELENIVSIDRVYLAVREGEFDQIVPTAENHSAE